MHSSLNAPGKRLDKDQVVLTRGSHWIERDRCATVCRREPKAFHQGVRRAS